MGLGRCFTCCHIGRRKFEARQSIRIALRILTQPTFFVPIHAAVAGHGQSVGFNLSL